MPVTPWTQCILFSCHCFSATVQDVDDTWTKATTKMHIVCWQLYLRNMLRVCIYIYTYIWVNYNDLTATSLESWLVRGIIPKWPYFSERPYFRLVNNCNLPRYIAAKKWVLLSTDFVWTSPSKVAHGLDMILSQQGIYRIKIIVFLLEKTCQTQFVVTSKHLWAGWSLGSAGRCHESATVRAGGVAAINHQWGNWGGFTGDFSGPTVWIIWKWDHKSSKYQTNAILEMQGGSIDTRFLGYPIFRDVDVRAVRDGDAEIMKL